MGQLILARSACTDYDDQHRLVGTLDIPVSVRGQSELVEMASDLADEPIEIIYAAAGEASRESARILGEKLDVPVRPLDDLRNQDFGLWQGLAIGDIRQKHPKVFRQWEESPRTVCPPSGEMLEQVLDRMDRALRPVLRKAASVLPLLIAPDPLRQFIRCHVTGCQPCCPWETLEDLSAMPIWEKLEVVARAESR